MNNINIFAVLVLTAVASKGSYCQSTNLAKPVKYSTEVGVYLSNGKTTFWQQANQYGTVPENSPYLTAQGSLQIDYKNDTIKHHKRILGWGAGINIVANAATESKVLIPEAYLKAHIGAFEIWGGRRREVYGLVADTLLSTGAYSWSGNALPIPKVQINTLGYVDVPFTRKLLAFKGSFSHGWFGDIPIAYEPRHNVTYLHQKSFFGRLGKPTWKMRLYGGVVHNVMWGNEANFSGFRLPLSEAYLGVISGDSWASSRIGNHLGSIDLGFDIKGKNWNYVFFRQTFFEAGALYWLRAIPDGLNSFSMTRRHSTQDTGLKIQRILIEFFHSVNQGGDVWDWDKGIFGRESYFTHYIYTNGWSNQGKIIGTPFIQLNNTRVYVYHVGLAGTYKTWNWRTKWSLSQNYGNYDAPLAESSVTQLSTIIEASKPLKILNGAELRTALSFDVGKLYANAVGVYVGIRKNGLLSK
jgi:hypothetical protein